MPSPLESLSAIMREAREREAAVQHRFLNFLRDAKAFPSSAIALDVPLPGRARPDLLIVDPESRRYLAAVEFKPSADFFAKARGNLVQQLVGYQAAAKDLSLPVFLVLPRSEDAGEFTIWRPDSDFELQEVDKADFPSFDALRALSRARNLEGSRADRESSVERLGTKSLLLASLLAILLLLAVIDWWEPTWEKLSLLGGLIGVVLFPEISRIKIVGLEIERVQEASQSAPRHRADG